MNQLLNATWVCKLALIIALIVPAGPAGADEVYTFRVAFEEIPGTKYLAAGDLARGIQVLEQDLVSGTSNEGHVVATLLRRLYPEPATGQGGTNLYRCRQALSWQCGLQQSRGPAGTSRQFRGEPTRFRSRQPIEYGGVHGDSQDTGWVTGRGADRLCHMLDVSVIDGP